MAWLAVTDTQRTAIKQDLPKRKPALERRPGRRDSQVASLSGWCPSCPKTGPASCVYCKRTVKVTTRNKVKQGVIKSGT